MSEQTNRDDDLSRLFGPPAGVVAVLAVGGPEAVMAATPVVLTAEARGHEVILVVSEEAPEGPGWSASIAAWFTEQARPVRLVRWTGALPDASAYVLSGGAEVLSPEGAVRAALSALDRRGPDTRAFAAVAGLGAEAAFGVDPAETDARLSRLVAHGGVLGVEAIGRYGTVGRHFVELVEHVHHLAGPTRQSVTADSLRAALFGRSGSVAVSLATRERPPRLSPTTTLLWFLALDELLRPE